MSAINHATAELVSRAPVIPVLVIDDLKTAVPLATALAAGGLTVLEVTMRTPVALDCIRAIADALPQVMIGAGTVNNPASVKAAVAAGSRFLVSPGSTEALLDAFLDSGLPFLAGAVTASEVLGLAERGLNHAKFFPAEPAGGTNYIKSLGGPLPEMRFCPTGGIDLAKAKEYLKLPNVPCVGGSWVAPADAVKAGDWARIETLAREAAGLKG
ncbi:bifunctional 4-hydroxy-2-oxoglutarate aldolase/2-dehydro-3-deoxy-phosphogluconate aldolase [Lacibacterium aquatile]|uniref:Bifunctional 4-hydroxy-2-oxoglutarate aldolase/2-dehydro-3-deoxy-phosphogluconate aldolase n=1 Tax=Lacibacterium aquatile TaxID=1168082 RepID=A0ABW5DUM6_9PROT